MEMPILVSELCKTPVYCLSLAGIAGSNSAGGMDVFSCERCQVEVSATGRSLVQRNATDCGV